MTYAAPTSGWHHWAVTFDEATGTRSIYLDGSSDAVATDTAAPITGANTTLFVGTDGSTFFNGGLDELRIWNIAVPASTIAANYQESNIGLPAGLIADWTFSEGQGTTAADSTGDGYTMTLSGNPTWPETVVDPTPPAQFSGFTIKVSGEVDLTIPDVPGGLQIDANASFTVNTTESSFEFTLNGSVNINPLGNALDIAGNFYFQDQNNTPELYGAFEITSNGLPQLQNLGLDLTGTLLLDFNTTGQSITDTLTLTSGAQIEQSLLPDSFFLDVTGTAGISVSGQQLLTIQITTFQAFFTTDSSNGPVLDVYLDGSLSIGPSNALEFTTTDFLQVSSAGLAASMALTFAGSTELSSAGIDISNASLTLLLNTTDEEITYTPISITDPGQTSTAPSVTVPAAPSGSTTASPYLEISGSGDLTIEKDFTLNGGFEILVSPSELEFQLDANLDLAVAGSTLFQLDVQGGFLVNSQGAAGAIELTRQAGLPTSSFGFDVGADVSFELEFSSTGDAVTLGGINLPQMNGPYALVQASGDLTIGPIDVSGSFEFEIDSTGLMMTLTAQAALGPLGQADINGELVVQGGNNAGLYGILQAALATSPDIPDVSLNLNFQFEINTTNVNQTVTGFTVDQTTGQITTGQPITLDAGTIQFDAGGNLTIVNMFDVAGQFDFTLNSSSVQIDAQATLTDFFGLNLGLSAEFDLTSGGLAVNAGLSLNESLPLGLLTISASPQLMINTTSQTLDGVAPNTYEVELNNADVNFLGLQASGSLIVGVSDGVFEIDVPSSNPLELSFFGLGGVSISGYIDSNGQFSLTGSVGFQLGQSGNEIWGSLQITISNNGFSGYFGGGCQIFGINIASVSGWLSINDGEIDLGAWVSVWIFGFGFNIEIGQLQEPQNVPNSLLFYSVPTTSIAGSTISLNASATDSSGNTAANSAYSWTIYYNNAQFGKTLYGADPSLELGDPGTYTVVMNEGSVSKTLTIQVADVPPTVSSLNLQSEYARGQSVTLAPSVYTPLPEGPGGLHYQWTILKDGQPYATANTPTFTFTPPQSTEESEGAPLPDFYQVSLTVSDNYGGSTTATGSFGTFDPNDIVVTSTGDTPEAGELTLRQAIAAAETISGVHYVRFASDLAGQTITLTSAADTSNDGDSAISIPSGTVVLDASNAPGVTIAAAPYSEMRIFYVPRGSELELIDLNLSGGDAYAYPSPGLGGAIYADGAVYSYNCAFINNGAYSFYTSAGGGAVYISPTGALFASETTFADNIVERKGETMTPLVGRSLTREASR